MKDEIIDISAIARADAETIPAFPPGPGTMTRQRSRASIREAAYSDAKETFKNAPRRVRRARAREAVKLVLSLQKGKAE